MNRRLYDWTLSLAHSRYALWALVIDCVRNHRLQGLAQ
jgi:membrane protein YqaA with SNARE-associated domain